MIFGILVAILAIAEANFDYPGRPALEDVKKFYMLGNITYLVKRTYVSKIGDEEPTCVHNKVTNVTGNKISLLQGYIYDSGQRSTRFPVDVQISRHSGYDVAPQMWAVTKDVLGLKRTYNFHYYDPVAQCAVLTFRDYSGTLRCELHTWRDRASYLLYGNCQIEYDYQCPGRQSHSVNLKNCWNLNT
ncbi:uncharacterized protein LOC125939993 [Dermacentor silvarum]|uniref:uncharacterized protein LOC125939993 n=1 Tax=Dermacentor silvarum TaxID=543639 RepID=UPI002101AF67|nr:uncharacterized protein LOC125939993 [Dermacentor silvarum]